MINLNPKSSTDFHIPSCLPLNVDIWGQSTPTERYKIMILLSFFSVRPFLSYLIYDFRKGRSTADHLVRFDGYIRNAFAKKEHVIAIFFDLEKAYDTTWKYGLLSDLYDLDFRGHLPTFIDGFLSHRLFQVRAGPLRLIHMGRRWVFPRVAAYLHFFSVLKLTILLSQS